MKRKALPNFDFEKEWWRKGYLVVGVDEVGRGALSGPIYVGAVCFQPQINNVEIRCYEALGIRDSKELTPEKRERLTNQIKKKSLTCAIGYSPVEYINKYGITKATESAVRKAIEQIRFMIQDSGFNNSKQLFFERGSKSDRVEKYLYKCSRRAPLSGASSNIKNHELCVVNRESSQRLFMLVDGFKMKRIKGLPCKNQLAIIKGDKKCISIAAASIIAKVERDRVMKKLSFSYKNYHWEKNKGYGTREHIEAIINYGKTKFHRDLFLRKVINYQTQSTKS